MDVPYLHTKERREPEGGGRGQRRSRPSYSSYWSYMSYRDA